MAWFKVDDKLPEHRKFRALRRLHPNKKRDVTALGLWVIAGAWSDDGFVPLEVMEDWDDDAEALADRLVECGLWVHGEKEGELGCWFHDWEAMNPTIEPMSASDFAEKGREGNHVKWHVNRGVIAPDCGFCRPDIAPISPPESPGDIAPDSENDRPESLPSRPDPTRPERNSSPADADERASTIESEFNTWYLAYPRRIGKGQARKAYTGARKKADPSALLDAAHAFASRCKTTGTDPKFIPHPSTWLNGERWLDQAEPDYDDSWDRYRYDPDTLEGA